MSDYGETTEGGALRFVRLVPGPIERVWSFFAEPEKRALWLAGGEIGQTPGAKVTFAFDHARITPHADDVPPEKYAYAGNETMTGTIIIFDPPSHMVFSWPGHGSDMTEVSVRLSEAGNNKVRLELVHSGIGGWSDLIGASAGWHVHLDIMLAHMEARVPPPFWATHTASELDYESRLAADRERFTD